MAFRVSRLGVPCFYPAKAASRAVLSSGKLGQLNGLPVTVVVYTTLQELESGCGRAVTATGTLLPMPTVIRMASHAYHYLTIFDKHTGRALHLGRTRRIASADQRIVLLARVCMGHALLRCPA